MSVVFFPKSLTVNSIDQSASAAPSPPNLELPTEKLSTQHKITESTKKLLETTKQTKPDCGRKFISWLGDKRKISTFGSALLFTGLIVSILALSIPAIALFGTLTLIQGTLSAVTIIQRKRREYTLNMLKNLKNNHTITPQEYECLLRSLPKDKVFKNTSKEILGSVIGRLRVEYPHKDWSLIEAQLKKGNFTWVATRLNHFSNLIKCDDDLIAFAKDGLSPKKHTKLIKTLTQLKTSSKFNNCPRRFTRIQERQTIHRWLNNLKTQHHELFEEAEMRAYQNAEKHLKQNSHRKFSKELNTLLSLLTVQAQNKLKDGYKSQLYFPDLLQTMRTKHSFTEKAKVLGTDHSYDTLCRQLHACTKQLEDIWRTHHKLGTQPNFSPEQIRTSFKELNEFTGMVIGQLKNENCTIYNSEYYQGSAKKAIRAAQDLSEAIIRQIQQNDSPHAPCEHHACCDFSDPISQENWHQTPRPINIRKAMAIDHSHDIVDPNASPIKPTTAILSANAGQGHRSGAEALARYVGKEHHISIIDSQKDMMLSLDGLYKITNGRISGEEFMNRVKQKQCWWLLKIIYWIERIFVNYDKRSLEKERAIIKRLLKDSPDLVASPIAKLNGPIYHVCKKLKIPFIITPLDVNPTNFLQGIPKIENDPLFALTIPYQDKRVTQAINGRIPDNQVHHMGYAVNPEYLSQEVLTASELKARRTQFNIPENKQVLTIAGGGLGSLSGLKFAEKLAKSSEAQFNKDLHIVICCGRDTKLLDKVRKLKVANPHITVSAQGFTTELHKLLTVSDVYLPKPGGGSTGEAFTLNIRTQDENGQERERKLFMLLDASNSKRLYWENDTVKFSDERARGKAVYPKDKVPDFINRVKEALEFKYTPDPDIDGKRPDVEFRKVANALIRKRKEMDVAQAAQTA